MSKEVLENVGSDSGSNSGSDRSGSVGNDSGSGSAGNVRGINRSGGESDGSGRGINAGNGSGSGSGSADDSGSGSDDILDIKPSNGNSDRNTNDVRATRAERIRRTGSIRLGSADRDNPTDGSARSGIGNADDGEKLVDEPVIRLGAKQKAKPRGEVKTDNTTELKLSEMKDLISMFLDTLFEVPAVILKQDFWRLQKEESKLLTDAVVAYIKSMPKDKSNWLTSFIQENLPLVNLLMIGFFIVADRVKGTIAVTQVKKHAERYVENVSADVRANSNGGGVRTPMDAMFSN